MSEKSAGGETGFADWSSILIENFSSRRSILRGGRECRGGALWRNIGSL
jgi:hypothetical protein